MTSELFPVFPEMIPPCCSICKSNPTHTTHHINGMGSQIDVSTSMSLSSSTHHFRPTQLPFPF